MIDIAILGFGIVGGGVYDLLKQNSATVAAKLERPVNVKKILDIRDFSAHPAAELFTASIDDILTDDSISVVVETIGGLDPAYYYVKSALEAKKSVVTSNKELVATHGTELIRIAKQQGVCFLFEASVGGGTPLITPLHQCLTANNIGAVYGIVNGTTNYILSQMSQTGLSFDEALKQAQASGFAEANPTADIEGIDALRKISILSSLCFGFYISPKNIPVCGISNVTADDIKAAEKQNCVVKLVAYAAADENNIKCGVSPMLVPKDHVLAAVNGVYNAVVAQCDMLGDVLFYGQGAGGLATASAIVADVLDSVRIGTDIHKTLCWGDELPQEAGKIAPAVAPLSHLSEVVKL